MQKEPIALTNFRSNLYALVDEVIRTGEPLWLERNGVRVKVSPDEPLKKSAKKKTVNDLSKIKPMSIMVVDADWYISPKLYEWGWDDDLS